MIIIALLVLIVFILLFGAGVVKGWLANAAGLGCGFLILLALGVWISSMLGEDGFLYLMLTVGALALVGWMVMTVMDEPKRP